MSRLQQILSAILILQIGVLVFVFVPRNAPDNTGALLIQNVEEDDVASLQITDDSQNEITITRDGEDWVLSDRGDYPVTGENVTTALEELLNITSDKLITQTSTSHKRLQVAEDDYQRKIVLTLNNDNSKTLYIGSSAGSQSVHVRLDGEDEVYLARDLSAWIFNAEASSWIDATYISIDSTAVVEANLENQNGTYEFLKTGDQWTMPSLPEGEEFNEANLAALLNRISAMNMKTPLGKEELPEYGLSNPQAVFTVTVQPEDGKSETITLTIGNDSEDGSTCFVYVSNSDYYAAVSKTTLEDFINRTVEDFIMQEATPTPAL